MLIDFNAALKDLDGKPIPQMTMIAGQLMVDGDKVWTLGAAATTALLDSYEDERQLSGSDKFTRFMLASKIHGQGLPVDVDLDEAKLIKDLIAKRFGALLIGRAWELLDPKPNAVESVA